MRKRWILGVAVVLAAIALARPAPAVEIAEVRGDFYYDAEGRLVGMRHAAWPEGVERRPMSAREKFAIMGIELPPRPAFLEPRAVFPKPAGVDDRPELSRDKVIVKFVEGLRVRLRDGALRADGASIPEVEAVLAAYPDARLERVFDVEERILDANKETGEWIGGRELPDLNNFYLFTFEEPSERGVALANALLGLGIVETAYLQAPGREPACFDIAPPTPLWEANQFHLDPAPDGVDAFYAWNYHGGGNGAGSGFWVADLEWGWCLTHEDYDADSSDVLNGATGPARDHGTAVLGIHGSCDNAYGMTGISPDVSLKMCDFDSEATWAANIAEADFWLVPGEIMLLEIHILGPDSGLTCVCNCFDFEYVPVEWDAASYAAIVTAVASGIVVVEAAGNGSMDLDSAIYGGWFDPTTHNSGAIMVGAAEPSTHLPECWTNYGSRVDVHGYGSGVFTTGYGDWWDQTGCSQDYTDTFGGTSSASPIVVGACAAMQGIANEKYGYDLSPTQMRTAIKVGGTPPGASTKHIGPMPDLADAINGIEPDLVASYTPAGWAYPAVPRPTNDATVGSVTLIPGPLGSTTYWNWSTRNQSTYSPTLHDPNSLLTLDDVDLWEGLEPNYAPGQVHAALNAGPNPVKGGRHTLGASADFLDVEEESNENNNGWHRQYIWTPLVLSNNAPRTRTWDPPAVSTGFVYYNAEGFSGSTGSQYWHAFAVMPTVATDDFDIRLNTEQPMNIPQQGFGAHQAWSASGPGLPDLVILDRNRVVGGTYWASVLHFDGTGSKIVEFDDDNGVIANPGTSGPFTLAAGNVVELHEVLLAAGTQTRIQVQWLSGNANCGLGVYGGGTGYYEKNGTIPGGYADSDPGAGDEWVIVQPGVEAWHGIAVFKSGSADLNRSLSYNLIVSQLPNLTDATPTGWFGPVVPRNTTDATANSVPLPPTLIGNQTTTSYNFSTFNEGPNIAAAPWVTRLYVDDVWYWSGSAGSLGAGAFQRWLNTQQGLDPHSLVRGGRHYIRLDADALDQVPEMFETDNTVVDWFVWTPYWLTSDVPVIRTAPPRRDPLGWIHPAVDGFRTDPSGFWTGVAVLPQSATGDYDVLIYEASTGSRDGFGARLDWSSDATLGAPDFCMVNYNATLPAPYDYGILNWNASTSDCLVQRASSVYHGVHDVPGVYRFGPFVLGANEILDLHEFQFGSGAIVRISVDNVAGGADLAVSSHDGNAAVHTKFTVTGLANAGGDGEDEHLDPFLSGGQYWCAAVYKSGSGDLAKEATYEVVVSIGGSAVDVPVLEAPPARFALSSPRPNPFGSETAFRLDVPANAGASTVAVYDLAGRRILTLAEGERPAGRHTLSWNGRDTSGRKVAAGVYFVRLETAGVTETRKLTLLR